ITCVALRPLLGGALHPPERDTSLIELLLGQLVDEPMNRMSVRFGVHGSPLRLMVSPRCYDVQSSAPKEHAPVCSQFSESPGIATRMEGRTLLLCRSGSTSTGGPSRTARNRSSTVR